MGRSIRWQLASIVSGLIFLVVLWTAGLFSSRKAIIIEYGMLGDDAIGAEVYIDDQLAGTLAAVGAASRTGFEVSEGVHTVRVVHPDLGCEPVRVETQSSSTALYLMLDVADFYNEQTGRSEPRIVFN